MRRRWAAIWLVTMLLATSLGATASAQYAEGLPPGVLEVTIGGQPIDANNTPELAESRPRILGRLEAGPATIELAIADGEVVRFPAEANRQGRFRAAPPNPLQPGRYALYINDAVIGEFDITAAADGTPTPTTGALLDIARVVPFPADLAATAPGIGLLDGRFFTIEEEAQRAATAAGDESAEAVAQSQQDLADAGWRQRYESRLAVPQAADPTQFDVQVTAFVIEYAAAEDAEAAFAGATGGTEGIDAATIGDESQFSSLSGVTPDTGAGYRAVRLIFRQDRLLSVIVYADLQNREPDLAAIEAMGQAVQARAAAVLAGEVSGLSPRALRLDLPPAAGRTTIREAYEVLDGVLIPAYAEEERDRAAREASHGAAPDVYGGSFTVRGADDSGAVFYTTTLYGFASPEEAEAWLAGLPDRLSQDPLRGYLSFSPVADAPTFGDASATYTFRRRSGEETASGFRVYVRVGAEIAAVELSAVPEASLTAVEELVTAQVSCLEDGACEAPVPLPAGLGAEASGRQ